MRKGIFTVVFMVLITVVFISVLAYMNEISRERVDRNAAVERIRAMLYACGIFPHGVSEESLSPSSTTADITWEEDRLFEMMQQGLKKVRLPVTVSDRERLKNSLLSVGDSVEVFVLLDTSGTVEGYGFPLRGKGLWGTISAFGVISSDLIRMVGIDFTEQVETPGLGARITETGFKSYFRNLDLSGFLDASTEQPAVVMVGKKDRTNVEWSTNSIQAITGATQTCNGVLKMVNTDLGFYITVLRDHQSRLEAFH